MTITSTARWPATWLMILLCLFLTACGGDSDSDDNAAAPPPDGGNGDANAFTLAVLPDTQKYSRYSPERYTVQTQWIADHYQDENIKFTVHLGDVVDRPGVPEEWVEARAAMQILEANPETPYSVLAGNHDVMNSGQWDDQRTLANEPFLQHFPASLQASNFSTFQGTDDTGFNSYHLFQAGDREYLCWPWTGCPRSKPWPGYRRCSTSTRTPPPFSPPISCWASAPTAKPPCSPRGANSCGKT